MLRMIDLFNSNVSDKINKTDSLYTNLFGDTDYTPVTPLVDSEDVNCGAVINEFEWAKLECWKLVSALSIDVATSQELDTVINSVIDLSRRGDIEADSTYRKRFRFLVTDKTNTRRITKWSILDAISYFIADMDTVQLIEPFDSENCYFQIRIEGVVSYDDIIFLGNPDQGYVSQNFIGGAGVGEVITYLGALVQRVKAAGVDFDILFIAQGRLTKTADATIGSIQIYKLADAHVQRIESFTKTADAVIA